MIFNLINNNNVFQGANLHTYTNERIKGYINFAKIINNFGNILNYVGIKVTVRLQMRFLRYK